MLDFKLISQAAMSIKEYGLAITYFELYAKKLRDENPNCFYENLLSANEIEHIVHWYAKKFPDDYNKEEFKTPLNEISMLDQGSQIWSQCNSQNENDEIETLYINETERNQHLELIRFYEMIDK